MARIANPLQRHFPRQPGPADAPIPVRLDTPSSRELRTQAVQRLQVGLFGLGGMLLMVGLANIVMERAHQTDAASAAATPAAQVAAPAGAVTSGSASDPLVDMGVAPELPVNKPSPNAKPDAVVFVPGNTSSPTPAPAGERPQQGRP